MKNYVNAKMKRLGAHRSVIRELFEYANKRRAEIGDENVFDFSIGNPSAPTPAAITDEMLTLLKKHSARTPARLYIGAGRPARQRKNRRLYSKYFSLARFQRFNLRYRGASAGLAVSLSALLNNGDEAIVFAPFFPNTKYLSKAREEKW